LKRIRCCDMKQTRLLNECIAGHALGSAQCLA